MKNEALEQQTRNLADRIIENQGSQINFKRDDEPSLELQQSVVENLRERGYRAEFHRFANDSLSISLSEIQDDEQDEIINHGW